LFFWRPALQRAPLYRQDFRGSMEMTLTLTIAQALARAGKLLKESGSGSPVLDADVLLSFITGLDRAGLYREGRRPLAPEEDSRYRELIRRRVLGEPVAYLTGEKEFMGISFAVTPAVLIPRPETELLVETALALLAGPGGAAGKRPGPGPAKSGGPVVIEAGAGSGAIAVSLAVELAGALVYATDLSPAALAVAQQNALRHGVGERVVFLCGDLLAPLEKAGAPRADLIAANLPYIASGEIPGLPRDVRCYEPLLALDGGLDGLDLYRRLAGQSLAYLRQGGHLLMEIGPRQAAAARALFSGPPWSVSVKKDLAGRDRLVVAERLEA